jgi:hypothetical protein
MWISDTGATKHSTKHKQGGISSRSSTGRTRGVYGQADKPITEVDLPGMYCNKSSKDQFAVTLQNVDIIPESHYNLISITTLMEEGHKVTENKKYGITVEKGRWVIKIDIRAETPKGVMWCAYIKQTESDRKVAVGMSNNKVNNLPNKSMQELTSAIKMSIEQCLNVCLINYTPT